MKTVKLWTRNFRLVIFASAIGTLGAIAGGFALAWHLQRARLPAWLCGVLVIAAGVYGASLALFSFAPPDLPIFTPPV